MSAPFETEPCPCGSPAPSPPRTSMSHPATSSDVGVLPYPKRAGSAAPATVTASPIMPTQAARPRLAELNIEHASVLFDLPGLDGVVVIDRIGAALPAQ